MAIAHDEMVRAVQKFSGYKAEPDGKPGPAEPAEPAEPAPGVDLDQKFQLLRSVGEECQTEPELKELIARKKQFVLYDGFEPSGRMHIAQGLFKAVNVNKCTEAGGIFKFYVADWFALMNDKMGGDMKKIKDTGMYFVHVWKSCGMKMENVRFIWTSDFIYENATEYWTKMLDISRVTSLVRVKRCCTIMGRDEGNLTAAQILYPLMQCTDIFLLRADICQLGLDQRKVNMQAREYCSSVGIKNKPIILSHHMMMGLKAGQAKMSKSDPDSAVFMEDSPEDVRRKITNAACPREKEKKTAKQSEQQGDTEEWILNNPVIDYIRYLVLENSKGRHQITVDGITYDEADSLERDFIDGKLSEQGLKESCIQRLNEIMAGCRRHFAEDKEASELVALVEQHKVDVLKEKENAEKAAVLRSLQVFDGVESVGLVFAPPPAPGGLGVTAETVLATLRCLVRAKKHQKLILWCEDWSCIALDRLAGDIKAITAYYGILAQSVKALASTIALQVEVMMQSEQILRDPNMYWISVIDAGRKKRRTSAGEEPVIGLDEVARHLPSGESLTESGQVVATLMHVADVLALCRGVGKATICASDDFQQHHQLAKNYLQESFAEVRAPEIDVEKQGSNAMSLVLGEGESIWNSKMKKSYCLEGDLDNNPLMDLLRLTLSCQLLDTGRPLLEVRQKAEHGGDKDYAQMAEVETAFASKDLHPSAFKPALQERVKSALAPLQQLSKDAAFKKLCASLENFHKAQSKKAKK
ncbi:unnamed protein product [Effrenium voratum]|uniref:tyrosine--tRNA ligase n=1 Tax=Effrenium voratum TaxID=2562239 RepID=A0AA36HQB3_9DINO|nr:unnamed protein product [Effrenium voratum]CAJ1415356.1 unnamed protein product [Effrenium voratum]